MTTNRTILKIFLASPGDLADERRAAKRIIDEENANHAHASGYQLELVGWEDTVAQHGRAQEIINRDLDQCNFFVGLVWKRWGTPPGPKGGVYSSGFEEEYERSREKFQATGKPSISLLFKSISDEDKRDVGPQLAKVLQFKTKFSDDYRGVYQTFEDLRDFEHRFRSIVAMFLRCQIDEDAEIDSESSSKAKSGTGHLVERPSPPSAIFEQSSVNFIHELVNRDGSTSVQNYTATDVARFRLLALSLEDSANDKETLGVHDANLMYRDLRDQVLSRRERTGLLRAGLSKFTSRVVPLWHWLYRQNDSVRVELAYRTIMGSDLERRNAFAVLSLAGDSLEGVKEPADRGVMVSWWLNSKTNDVVTSALDYLAGWGVQADIPEIEALLGSSEATIARAAVTTKASILSRRSVADALEFIASREEADLPTKLLTTLMSNLQPIETRVLKLCLNSRSSVFRNGVGWELLRRNELTLEEAKIFSESPDINSRVLGATSTRHLRGDFSMNDARAIIVKPKNRNSLLLGGRDYEGEERFEVYKHDVLCEKNLEELKLLRIQEGVYSYDVTFAIYDRFFSHFHDEIVYNIDDEFKTYMSRKRESLESPSSASDEKIDTFLRGKMLQKAAVLLCEHLSRNDIDLVRGKVDAEQVKFALPIVKYFHKLGGWQDVRRIISLCSRLPNRGLGILSSGDDDQWFDFAAKALIELSKGRVGDLLALDMPSGLLVALFARMSRRQFRSFDDKKIDEWLRSKSDSVRQAVALKAVLSLPKARVTKLLESYVLSSQTYYYNAVFWLDLGSSSEKRFAARVAGQALAT